MTIRHSTFSGEEADTIVEHIRFDIVNLLESGFLGRWTIDSKTFSDRVKIEKGHPEAAKHLVGVPIEFEANHDGSPIRLRNRVAFLEELERVVLLDALDEKSVKERVKELEALSDDDFAAYFLPVLSQISLCHNTNLRLKHPHLTSSELDGASENAKFTRSTSYELSFIDFDTQLATINLKSKYELKDEGQEEPDNRFKATDTGYCVLETNGGRVTQMSYSEETLENETEMLENFQTEIKWFEP